MKKKSIKINAILNVIKQLCNLAFPLITFPYASRVLGKGNYGKFSFGISIISYLSLIAGLGIGSYAIREGSRIRDDKKEIDKFVNEVFTINVISTVFSFAILALMICFWPKINGYTALLIVQSMIVLFTTIGTDWINTIYEDYLYITIRYIICQIISIVLMFILVKNKDDLLMYAIANVSATVLANISNFFYVRKKYSIYPIVTKNACLKKHCKPIFVLFGNSVAGLIYINSDVILLGILSNDSVVGLYSVAAKIYSLAKTLLNAILIVSIPRIAYDIKHINKDQLNKELSDLLGILLIFSFPACVGLCSISSPLILLISGIDYVEAASALRILSGSLLFATLACFFNTVVLISFRREKETLVATLISAFTNIVLNVIFIPIMLQNAAAITTLLSEFIMAFLGMMFCRNLIELKLKRALFVAFFNASITFACCRLCACFIEHEIILLFVSVIFSILACAVIVALFYKEIIMKSIKIIRKR